MNIINQKALNQILDELVESRLETLIARIEELENQKAPEYMTKQEAASYLKCSTSTIDNYVRNGLPKGTMSKGKVLFERSNIDEYVAKRIF